MVTESAQRSTRTNFSDIVDTGVVACIAYIVKFVFGGTFLGITLILIGIQFQGTVGGAAASLAGSFLATVMFWRRGLLSTILAIVMVFLVFTAAQFVIRGLATMATNGVYGPDESGRVSYYVGNYLLFGILWLILGVPYRAFKYKIDQSGEGKSQNVVTVSLAAVASLLTGAFVLLLHSRKGPFSQVDIKALIVGGIFTVFLVVPIYRAIAKACWQRGILGILSPRSFLAHWREAAIEIDTTKLKYYTELYSRKRQAKLPVSNNDSEDIRHKKPRDQTSAGDKVLSPPKESREAEQKRSLGHANSTRSEYGRRRGQSRYGKKNSRKRRK